MTTALELLAPAKTCEIGMAAVDHGADAVYIGAPRFSARAEAGNTIAEIARLVAHAHLYYAKVYVALNTILTNAEISAARDLIQEIHRIQVDGLILQDMGLLELNLPPIPLIASTQTHNISPEKVKFLQDVGFKRVILARELSVEEIAAIRGQTEIELEAFVHGALCVSYSGQCYMSQAVARRSGNRGICAQPCRSRYTLTDGDGRVAAEQKFLLSLKDLNLIDDIAALAAAGVTSFKIEGRYKDIDYVKNVTAAYRMAIDHFIRDNPEYRRASSGSSTYTFSPDLSRTFNRGYTRYFIDGRGEEIASVDTRKAIGQCVGKVAAIGRDYFQIAALHPIENGDGLCFFTARNNLAGFRVNRVDGDRIYPNSLKDLVRGATLYRNHDQAFARALNKASAVRKINIEMEFTQKQNKIHLKVTDEDGNQSDISLPVKIEPARNPQKMKEQIGTQLAKTGNTPYSTVHVVIHTAATPGFVPVSVLNDIRRQALEALTHKRIDAYPRQYAPLLPNSVAYPDRTLDYHANILNDHARRFYQRHGVTHMEPAFETLSNTTGKTVMTTRYCIRRQLNACLKTPRPRRILKEPLKIDDGRHSYSLEFDCNKCRMKVILLNS